MSQRRAIWSVLAGSVSVLIVAGASLPAAAQISFAPVQLNTDYAGQLRAANQAMISGIQANQQARAAQVLRHLDINNPASVDSVISELVKAGATEQADAVRARAQEMAEQTQLAQRKVNKEDLWRNVGTLASLGRCADARTLALQNGDFDLANQLASGCTEVHAPAPMPGQ